MKIAAVCVVILVCVAGAGFAADTDGADAFEKMLAGTRAGTAFAEFVDAHPEARYSDEALRAAPVDKEAPGALLIVHTEDPFLGLYSFSNIGFKEGKLYEFVAVWKGNAKTVRGHCARFLAAVMKRHGREYTKKSMRVFPDSSEEQTVAVFFWEDAAAATLAFYTPPAAAETMDGPATLTYAQFTKGDPFLTDIFSNNAARPEKQEQVWRDIDDIVKALK
ncbi:MAG: hypothetical protein BWY09_01297 [Candidatus Hydrogenedentes bacterium ADurb.Bin179]|nr:MAG: hypothetical protein BWY09_01297 [Candidatus Hydrogenedentes bacterium ADurb.Bin179]